MEHPPGARHLDAAPHGATRRAIPISINSEGAEGGHAALALAPEPGGTRGREPTEAAAAEVAVA